jgi:predicted CXXCH cytochrome family protein
MITLNKRKHILHGMVGLLALVVLLLPMTLIMAQEDTGGEADETTGDEAEVYTQGCAECHIDIVTDWEGSAHASAFTSAGFQEALASGADDSCYACHATGYEAFSGEFTHAAVTCEACHGQTPAEHPDEPISVQPNNEICADCHTTTYHEWEASPHGAADLDCVSCHNPHPQEVRFGDTNTLCLNCHGEEERPSYAHVTHEEETCTSCHWHHGSDDFTVHVSTGELPPSGHDGNVETLACLNCHEE